MANKSGKVEIGTVLIWIVILGGIAYLANFGGFATSVNGFVGGFGASPAPAGTSNTPVLTDTKDCPTDGTTTYTFNVQNALTSTATSLYPQYFVFNGNQLIKEGTLSSTASTVSLACGKDYKVLLVNTTAANGLYGDVLDLNARISQQTVNAQMIAFGGATINFIANPNDVVSHAANVTLSANGGPGAFDVNFKENTSNSGFNRPILLCQANVTSIKGITLTSFTGSDGNAVAPVAASLPVRITATAGYRYYQWEYPKMLTSKDNSVTAHLLITPSSIAPSVSDSGTTCKLVDQATWQTSTYKTSTSIDDGFKTGAENTETIADVGAGDSASATLLFDTRGY